MLADKNFVFAPPHFRRPLPSLNPFFTQRKPLEIVAKNPTCGVFSLDMVVGSSCFLVPLKTK